MLLSKIPQRDSFDTAFGGPNESAQGGGIADIISFALSFLRRYYILIIFTTALAFGASIVYLRVTPPTYTAQVQVLLNVPRAQFVQQQALLTEQPLDSSQIETQLQIIRSKGLASSVIKGLQLADDPDFIGSPSLIQSLWQKLRGLFSQPDEEPEREVSEPSEGLIGGFQGRLQAGRAGFSNIIEISFSSSRGVRAAEIANAVANAYIAGQLAVKSEANRSATAWLQDRLRDLNDEAIAAERAVNKYKAEHNIVSAGGKPIDEQQIADLNARLVAARTHTSDALTKLNQYKAILQSHAQSSSLGMLDAAGSDAVGSPIINSLRQQYLELSRRESEWSTRFGANHLAVVSLRTRMRELRSSILEEVSRFAEVSRGEYEISKQRQEEIKKQLDEAISLFRIANSAEVTLRELESQAKNYRNIYDTFLQRYTAAAKQDTLPATEARVIYPALPPETKSKPKTLIVMALGAICGLGLGTLMGLLRDTIDRGFRTSAQIEAALQIPCLSLVPRWRMPKRELFRRVGARPRKLEPRERTISLQNPIHWAVIDMPLSRFAEAIRMIKLGVDLDPTRAVTKVIGITSALPGEGKTAIAASLAQLIGNAGKSVLLVDCDLRNPSLSASLAPDADAGILELIEGKRSLESTVWTHPTTKLAFLPAVRRDSALHTSEILSADSTRDLFARLRTKYDYVIVDLPPLSPIVDVRVTGALVDGFLLVVEWEKTKSDVVQHALQTAPSIYRNLIGTILNKVDEKAIVRYQPYLRDYYKESNYTIYEPKSSSKMLTYNVKA